MVETLEVKVGALEVTAEVLEVMAEVLLAVDLGAAAALTPKSSPPLLSISPTVDTMLLLYQSFLSSFL